MIRPHGLCIYRDGNEFMPGGKDERQELQAAVLQSVGRLQPFVSIAAQGSQQIREEHQGLGAAAGGQFFQT